MRFDWDPAKARENLRKHGVSFTEAVSAFEDELSMRLPDPDHSIDEERYVLLGMSSAQRLLSVVHSFTDSTEDIRIISARRSTPSEHAQYGTR